MTIPMAIVPVIVTEAMYEAVESSGGIQQSWDRMLAASPTSGRVSRADLERAARAMDPVAWNRAPDGHLYAFNEERRAFLIQQAGVAFEALGLSLEPGIQDEGGV